MMTLLRTSLCASALLVAFAVPTQAAPTPAFPTPADFGATTLTETPMCAGRRPDPMRVAAVLTSPELNARPACCMGHLRCSQYLATTRINRGHELSHT
jgi:hypothetical protein